MSKASFKRMMKERAVSPMRPSQLSILPRRVYEPPSDEQLANFVSALVNAEASTLLGGETLAMMLTPPRMARLMLDINPEAKRGWLQRHREFQEAANKL